MSPRVIRCCCALIVACLLLGCDSVTPPADVQPAEPAQGSAATPSVPPAASSAPINAPISPSAPDAVRPPDAVLRELILALQDNQLERVWAMLPSMMQNEINAVVREVGSRVDAELWDESFRLLNRYVAAIVVKEDMFYHTPEVQGLLESFQKFLGASGKVHVEAVSLENIRPLATPLRNLLTTLLDSEISTAARLQAFNGADFCDQTLSPAFENLTALSIIAKKQFLVMANDAGNRDIPAILTMSTGLKDSLSRFAFRIESIDGESAVVAIEVAGNAQQLGFIRIGDKWIPQQLLPAFSGGVRTARQMIPTLVAGINAKKAQVMPALKELEPLVADLEAAESQEDFNAAFAEINSRAMELFATPGTGASE